MHAFWSKLLSQRDSDRTLRKIRRRESNHASIRLHASSGACKDECRWMFGRVVLGVLEKERQNMLGKQESAFPTKIRSATQTSIYHP